MSVVGSGWAASVSLRETKRDRCLPVTEVELLLRSPAFLNRGFQFAFKIQLGDLARHRPEQRVIASVGFAGCFGRRAGIGLVHPKGGKADRAPVKSVEQEFCEIVAPSYFRNPKRVVGTDRKSTRLNSSH